MRGWCPFALRVDAAGQGGYGIPAGGMKPDSAVVHTIEGWQSTMMAPSWGSNSYHATFRHSDGRIVQHVSIFTPAWHAGRVDSSPPTWKLYRGVNPNTHTIGISAEGKANPDGTSLPLAWSEPQIENAIKFLKWAGEEAGIEWNEDTLTEHSKIAVLTRKDPGPRWPKSRVLAEIGKKDYVDRDYTVVRPGEWLSRVATRVGKTVNELVQLNAIADPNKVEAWQVLRLHAGVAEPPEERRYFNGYNDALHEAVEIVANASSEIASLEKK